MQGNNNKGGKIKFLARADSNFKPIKCSFCPKGRGCEQATTALSNGSNALLCIA